MLHITGLLQLFSPTSFYIVCQDTKCSRKKKTQQKEQVLLSTKEKAYPKRRKKKLLQQKEQVLEHSKGKSCKHFTRCFYKTRGRDHRGPLLAIAQQLS
jgi:hypothetical protein